MEKDSLLNLVNTQHERWGASWGLGGGTTEALTESGGWVCSWRSGRSKGVDLLLHFHWPVSSYGICKGALSPKTRLKPAPGDHAQHHLPMHAVSLRSSKGKWDDVHWFQQHCCLYYGGGGWETMEMLGWRQNCQWWTWSRAFGMRYRDSAAPHSTVFSLSSMIKYEGMHIF